MCEYFVTPAYLTTSYLIIRFNVTGLLNRILFVQDQLISDL